MLNEMDGISEGKAIVVLAATNKPKKIDPALLRPGRFDRLIYVPPPDFEARLEILRLISGTTPFAEGLGLESIAQTTEGYSGAEIVMVIREAALMALNADLDASEVS